MRRTILPKCSAGSLVEWNKRIQIVKLRERYVKETVKSCFPVTKEGRSDQVKILVDT